MPRTTLPLVVVWREGLTDAPLLQPIPAAACHRDGDPHSFAAVPLFAGRNWVLTGRYALPADTATARLPQITPEIPLAQAHFRMGVWLRQHGNTAEADAHLAEASRLHPESWNM